MRSSLGEHEQTYVTEVRRQLRDVPAMRRRELLDQATDHLAERPAAETSGGLADALGSPGEYAMELRADAGIPARFGRWQRFLGQRRGVLAAQIITASALLVGSLVAWSWFTAAPNIFNSCGGVVASDVEAIGSGSRTEYRVVYHEQQRMGISLCLVANPGVTVESISVPFSAPIAQPVGVELSLGRTESSFVGDASAFHPYNPSDYPWVGGATLWFEFDVCGANSRSFRFWFDSVDVGYHYRGLSDTLRLDLGYFVSIALDGGCYVRFGDESIARARYEAEQAQWSSVFGGLLRNEISSATDSIHDPHVGYRVGRNLCRFLRGVVPASGPNGETVPGASEPLAARDVFNLGNDDLAVVLIDASLEAICPEFADRRDELVALVPSD